MWRNKVSQTLAFERSLTRMILDCPDIMSVFSFCDMGNFATGRPPRNIDGIWSTRFKINIHFIKRIFCDDPWLSARWIFGNIWQYLALNSMGADVFALTRFWRTACFICCPNVSEKKQVLIANFLISTFVHSYLLITFESLYSTKFLSSFLFLTLVFILRDFLLRSYQLLSLISRRVSC